MYSGAVLVMLFLMGLAVVWLLLVGAKAHDKAIEKTEKFTKNNFGNNKGESV